MAFNARDNMIKNLTKKQWITRENYVSEAENVWKTINTYNKDLDKKVEEKKIKFYQAQKEKIEITTSKIRTILSLNTTIYNDVMLNKEENLALDIRDNIQYLKVRIAYECGRDEKVKEVVTIAQLLEEIDRIGDKREKYLTFSRYLESLVAYHRYFGGRDN